MSKRIPIPDGRTAPTCPKHGGAWGTRTLICDHCRNKRPPRKRRKKP